MEAVALPFGKFPGCSRSTRPAGRGSVNRHLGFDVVGRLAAGRVPIVFKLLSEGAFIGTAPCANKTPIDSFVWIFCLLAEYIQDNYSKSNPVGLK